VVWIAGMVALRTPTSPTNLAICVGGYASCGLAVTAKSGCSHFVMICFRENFDHKPGRWLGTG
jgi:hypothetical protein